MKIHWNILDDNRKKILPLCKDFSKDGFYLAGGTGLALQIGHRDSVDFDFFRSGDYDTHFLAEKIESIFKEHKVLITQEEKNTLSCLVDGSVQFSFFGYDHKILNPFIQTDYFSIASIEDIGCMKLAAIVSRSREKDYVDLCFILKDMSLKDLLQFCAQKYPTLDAGLILKSLIYFDDIKDEPILFKEGNDIPFESVKNYLRKIVEDYFK